MHNTASHFNTVEEAFNYLARNITAFDIDLEFHTATQRPKLVLTKDDPEVRLAIDPVATNITGADDDYVITTYEHGTHWLAVFTDDERPGARIEEAEATPKAFASTAMPFDRALERIVASARTYTESANSPDTSDVDNTDTPATTDSDTDGHTLHFDGASRGNPGNAATGYVLINEPTGDRLTGGNHIGEKTNNEAEYRALLHGLRLAIKHSIESLTIRGDSKLIVNQVTGDWDCNSENLKPLLEDVQDCLDQFDSWSIEHVPRDDNACADEAANTALDRASA